MFGVVDLVWISRTNINDLGYIFVHEITRSCLDRLPNEILKTQSFDNLIKIACSTFGLHRKNLKGINMDSPLYSYMKKDNLKTYNKVVEKWSPDSWTTEFETLKDVKELYNQINYRNPLTVSLFNYVLENVIKVNRSI